MEQYEVPGQVQAVLQLPEADLYEHDREHRQRRREKPRRARAPGREVAEQEQERAAEESDDAGVCVEHWFEAGEPVDLRRASAGVRACGRGERAADDEPQARYSDAGAEEPKLPWNEGLGPLGQKLGGEEDEHDRTRKQHHR